MAGNGNKKLKKSCQKRFVMGIKKQDALILVTTLSAKNKNCALATTWAS
jgi:hypothetical protein